MELFKIGAIDEYLHHNLNRMKIDKNFLKIKKEISNQNFDNNKLTDFLSALILRMTTLQIKMNIEVWNPPKLNEENSKITTKSFIETIDTKSKDIEQNLVKRLTFFLYKFI